MKSLLQQDSQVQLHAAKLGSPGKEGKLQKSDLGEREEMFRSCVNAITSIIKKQASRAAKHGFQIGVLTAGHQV